MKHYLLALTSLFVFCSNLMAQSQVEPKLSPNTKNYLLNLEEAGGKLAPIRDYVYTQTANGIYMSAMVKVSPGFSTSALAPLGVHVGTKAGNIWTVQIPIDNVQAFTLVKGMEYIELDVPVCMSMDSVRKAIHVDSVHQGINLPMPYTGKDVVLGIVDIGFDFTNPNFMDSTGHIYRIKRAWLEKTPGAPPTAFMYGSEHTDSASIYDAHTDNTINSHGSHVTGIAGGSGRGSYGSNDRYRGIAYETDIVLVGISPDSLQWQSTGISNIVDGINYVYQYAASVGKPAVVNLSWGTVVGPHDGTSLFSQAVDNLTGAGKIFSVSAGNEGQVAKHLKKEFTATDTVVNTFMNWSPGLPDKSMWVDIWGNEGKTFCVQASLYHGTLSDQSSYICLDNNVHRIYLKGSDGDTCIVTFTTSTSEFNNKPRVYLGFNSTSRDTVMISVKANDGSISMWSGYIRDGHGADGVFTQNNRSWAVAGDTDVTVSDLVSTQSAISVGAFCSKTSFRNIMQIPFSQSNHTPPGQIRDFSSHGPTADGRIKPDIAAPGSQVISSVNFWDSSFLPSGDYYSLASGKTLDSASGRTYIWAGFEGTSMSSPAAAGTIALMLQINPQLNPSDVRNILALTAIQDSFTGVLPVDGNNTWGHGKINAYQAVLMASTYRTGISNVVNTLNCTVFPNPSTGKFTLDYTADKEENLSLQVFALDGKTVLAEKWQTTSGNNKKPIDLSTLGNAIYIIKVTSSKGQTTLPVMVAK